MIPAVTATSPVSHSSVAKENNSCICADICVRVQAVWNAFLALLSDFISYCGSWFAASELASPERESALVALLDRYEQFADTTHVRTWNGTTVIKHDPIRTSGNTLSYAEKMEKVRKCITDDRLLFLVANPYYTRAGGNERDPEANNRTKLLLELGANPNQTGPNEGHRPLLYAVLTGSFLAYKTLREFGALPVVEIWNRFKPGTRIPLSYVELAENILQNKFQDCSSIEYYFTSVIPLDDSRSHIEYKDFIPYEMIKEHPKYLGTDEDVQKMIDFEDARVVRAVEEITELWQISRPIANLIATYNEYY